MQPSRSEMVMEDFGKVAQPGTATLVIASLSIVASNMRGKPVSAIETLYLSIFASVDFGLDMAAIAPSRSRADLSRCEQGNRRFSAMIVKFEYNVCNR